MNHFPIPSGCIDVILDTDTYNEVDDQYALAYMLKSSDRINVKGICAAPFYFPEINDKSDSAADGMEKSYHEILHILELTDRKDLQQHVYRGSDHFLKNEKTAVSSDAANFMAELANEYSVKQPLYIVAIGAITNVASAILLNPSMVDKTVIIWLGGHAQHMSDTYEFNMVQDIAAARIIFGCGVPFVQLPCMGVVDRFAASRYELEHWMGGKNKVCDYLLDITITDMEKFAAGKPWVRIIWDVTAVAWLLNDNDRFMESRLIPSPIPEYDRYYSFDSTRHMINYVYHINRDAIFEDLFQKLASYQ